MTPEIVLAIATGLLVLTQTGALLWARRAAAQTAALTSALAAQAASLADAHDQVELLEERSAALVAEVAGLSTALEVATLLKAQVELATQGLLLMNDRLASIERLEHETTTWRRDLQAGSPSQVALGELGIGLSARIGDLERDLQAYGPSHVHEWRLVSVEDSGGHHVQIRRCTGCDRLDRWIVP
jgi:hypothetical protein